jgi:sugar phosphate isomerase/epimerase
MYCAISTACLYPLETEKSLTKFLNLGFRRFEIFANCESEFSDAFISKLAAILKPSGAKVCSMHLYTSGFEPFMFFSDYSRRFNDSVAQYGRYFEKAARLGAGIVVFHGDRRDGRLSLEEYCERFSVISDKALSEGVMLAQENVSRCRSATVEAVRGMKRLLGSRVRFVLDVKQALRAGESPLDMCDAMGENIACVHLSDSSPQKDCLLPGAGTFDLADFCSRLSKYSFDGPLTIEVYRNDFKSFDELLAAFQFVTRAIEK